MGAVAALLKSKLEPAFILALVDNKHTAPSDPARPPAHRVHDASVTLFAANPTRPKPEGNAPWRRYSNRTTSNDRSWYPFSATHRGYVRPNHVVGPAVGTPPLSFLLL